MEHSEQFTAVQRGGGEPLKLKLQYLTHNNSFKNTLSADQKGILIDLAAGFKHFITSTYKDCRLDPPPQEAFPLLLQMGGSASSKKMPAATQHSASFKYKALLLSGY